MIRLALLGGAASFAAGCAFGFGDCARGPTYMVERAFTVVAGQPVDQRLPLDANGDGSGKDLRYLTAPDAPAGLKVAADGTDIRFTGVVKEPGSHLFGVSVHAALINSACGAWGSYRVTLDVTAQ